MQNWIKSLAFPYQIPKSHVRFHLSHSSKQILNSIIQFYSLNTCSINLIENLPSLRSQVYFNRDFKTFELLSDYI